MLRTIVITMAFAAAAAPAARAGDLRREVSFTAGWTFSDGVSGTPAEAALAGHTRISPEDAFSWGARVGFFPTSKVELGALFGMQATTLGLGEAPALIIGDEHVYNYHAYFSYNFGDKRAVARPYVLGGLGATHFGSVTATVGSLQRRIDDTVKLSTTWAVGLKAYANENTGVRFEVRWTPTYIKSDALGWWCDPYWGCYTAGDAQYSNQLELSVGLNFRF